MNKKENEEFTEYLKAAVREAERLKYYPNRFKSMLDADGGFDTVNRILTSGKPSEGFTKLWELGRVDLTCEAIIVETKWRSRFSSDLIAKAEKLLREVRYPFEAFKDHSAEEGDVPPQTASAMDAGSTIHDVEAVEATSVDVVTSVGRPVKDIELDIQEVQDAQVNATTRAALIDARLGQGRFRRELMRRWNSACAVTGCRVGAVLRASHCKPWRSANNRERLDSNNGLILAANLDALFDVGLISFDDSGEMLVASVLTTCELKELGLPRRLVRTPGAKLKTFLEFHRDRVFLR